MHAVGLDELTHVHELPQQRGRPGRSGSPNNVAGLGRGQVVADGADAADALGDLRHLEVGPALAELLQPPELVHVQIGPFDLASFVEVQGDAGVAFDAGDGFDGDLLGTHFSSPWKVRQTAI